KGGPAPRRGDGRGPRAGRRPGQPALPAAGAGRPAEAHALALRPLDAGPDRDRAALDRRGRSLARGGGAGDDLGAPRLSRPSARGRSPRRAPARVQPRRAADPRPQLLHLPRFPPESPADWAPAPPPGGPPRGP